MQDRAFTLAAEPQTPYPRERIWERDGTGRNEERNTSIAKTRFISPAHEMAAMAKTPTLLRANFVMA